MKFLVAFFAVVGYASASVIAPLGLGVNPNDVQAAAINTGVAIQDNAQAWSDATRLAVDTTRDANENAVWNGIAAAQGQAAAVSGAISGSVGLVAPLGVSTLGVGAPIAVGGPLGIGAGLGAINGLGVGLPVW